MISLLTKDDIFISYSRGDGALYAAGLADKLTAEKFSCFLDRLGTEPNADLPQSCEPWLTYSLTRLWSAGPAARSIHAQIGCLCRDAWVERLEKLEQSCEVAEQFDRLAAPPEGIDVFSRCNLWILNSGRVELGPRSHLYSLLVWDTKPTGDGPGGTSDCASRVDALGGEVAIIKPTEPS